MVNRNWVEKMDNKILFYYIRLFAKYFLIFVFYFHSLNLSNKYCHSQIKIDHHRDIIPLKI